MSQNTESHPAPSHKFEEDRLAKLRQLRAEGIDPYGQRYVKALTVKQALDAYSPNEEGKKVSTAGRITALRRHGKAAFLDVRDWTGKIQVYFRREKLGDQRFALFELLDMGDIIGVEGGLMKTRTGEITIFAEDFAFLTKALLPLPEKWHGLKDVELRYRQRYLDLISNPEVMETFLKRIHILKLIRQYLDERGFVEVETPMMQSIAAGAAAKPFTTHHNTLDIDLYLRISPELYLKRLLVGGMEKVYEINRNFRNEGISTRHNPEFTMMEIYQAFADYNVMMNLTEGLFTSLVAALYGPQTKEIPYGDTKLNMASPWPRRKFGDLLREYAGVSLGEDAAIRAKAKALGLEAGPLPTNAIAGLIFEKTVDQNLVNPTFVVDYPVEICPLTKRRPDDPTLAQRFELYINGMELANAYTELNDPSDQQARFEEQLRMGTDEVREIDTDFITALKHGMPPAGGLGIGIDRLVMILTNSPSIRDVLLFPLLRPVSAKP
jgi:lysyl-tRNA synthetase class 2